MDIKELKCKICIKSYNSYKSLWNHNKKFHKNETNNDVTIDEQNVTIVKPNVMISKRNVTINKTGTNNEKMLGLNNNVPTLEVNSLRCELCNKIFATRQSKYEHKKKSCKIRSSMTFQHDDISPRSRGAGHISNPLTELLELRACIAE